MLKLEDTQIRPLEISDLDNLMTWINDPDVVGRYAYFTEEITREEEKKWLQSKLNNDTDYFYAIENEEGVYLGNVAIEKIHWPAKHGDLSITIGKKQERGKGHGYRAISLILKIAFEKLNLHKVQLLVAEDNARGLHLYEKCGFIQEGFLRDHYVILGNYINMYAMSILEDEYFEKINEPE